MSITFKDFERIFLEHYSLLNDANITYDQLYKLRQFVPIHDYIKAFDNIVMLLPELPEAD